MSAGNICNIRQNCGSAQHGTIRRHYNRDTILQKDSCGIYEKWNLKFNQILVLCAFAAVIAFPRISFNGVLSGLKLWGEVILPGLFPAMILTSCILYLFPLKPGLSYLYVCITGLLCGFPVGAFLCSKLHEANPDETLCERLMPFCNLSSPSFIINYILFSSLNENISAFFVLLCIYLPALECIVTVLILHRAQMRTPLTLADESNPPAFSQLLDDSIWSAVVSILKLGGYIIVFSCLSAYICLLPIKNIYITGILCGITEITNGIYLISRFPVPLYFQTLLILAVNAFGGFSTVMQTAGITKRSSFGIKNTYAANCFLRFLPVFIALYCFKNHFLDIII